MCESKALYLCAVVLCRTYKKSLVRRPLGALKLTGNVDDPPTWCGAAWTIFVRGTWRPPSLVEKLLSPPSLVEKLLSGTWDQGDRDCVHGRDLIVGKQYSL